MNEINNWCTNAKIDYLEDRMTNLESSIKALQEILNCISDRFPRKDDERAGDFDKLNKKFIMPHKSIEEQKIDDIMNNFRFNRVYEVMKFLQWEWAGLGSPTIQDIKDHARNLLERAVKEKTTIACGGLRAVYEDSEDPYIALEFIVEDMEGFAEDETGED